MIIHSDWHIHSENSYDATLPLETIADGSLEFGFRRIGITDHANFNDTKFLCDLASSVKGVKEAQKKYPHMVLGVELTPIEKPEFDYIAKTGTREGYVAPVISEPFGIELAESKAELMARGVRYAIGAAHWRVDVPLAKELPIDREAMIREWYRQQTWLASDERVTVLGHPWYSGKGVWYEDFSVIPKSMNRDIAALLKANGKYAECNSGMFFSAHATEKFKHQYAEFLREWFECGISITYGSDSHKKYAPNHLEVEKYLIAAGFKDGDISEIAEEKLW